MWGHFLGCRQLTREESIKILIFNNIMGQTQESSHKTAALPQPTLHYQVDIHLLQFQTVLPSSFSFAIQKLISQVEAFSSQIQQHPIEHYLIHALDQRFRAVSIEEEAFHSGMDPTDYVKISPPQEWSQLASKQAFLKLIQHLQRSYHIQNKIREEYVSQLATLDKRPILKDGSYETLRKQILLQLKFSSQLDLGLIMRLVFYYYLKMFKLNANTSGRQVVQFHTQTGRMLCLLIFHGYLTTQELFELLYHLVSIDKGPQGILKKKLQEFHNRFHGLCLKHAHSIGIAKQRLQVIQTTAKLYLDQLYLKSLEEAEDPQIKSSDDVLLPIKVFPISRVKDKQRV